MAKKTNPKSGRKKETKKPPSSAVKKKKKAPGAKRPQNHRSKVSRSSKTVSQKPVRKKKPSGRTSAKNRSYLTPQELEHYRAILLEKLQEITGDVHWLEKEGLHKSRQNSTGDLSTMPIHMADIGTDTYEQEFSLGLMDSERKMVREILDALKRIEQGTYGICEGTGKPIPKGRLEANPWARYCVEYASLLEQGKVIEHRYSGPARFADGLGEEEEEEETEADETPEEEEMDLEENEIDGNVGFDEEELEEEEETFF